MKVINAFLVKTNIVITCLSVKVHMADFITLKRLKCQKVDINYLVSLLAI